jgi:hypothetical protein
MFLFIINAGRLRTLPFTGIAARFLLARFPRRRHLQDGTAAAIRGAKKDYRAFPFHAIWKRIRDRENGFFKPIYISLEEAATKDWASTNVP